MYQSRESLKKDMRHACRGATGSASHVVIYIEVSDIGDVEQRLAGCSSPFQNGPPLPMATEIGVREPAGNLIVFAQQTQGDGPSA
jgi:hypothetical protein